MVIFMFHRTKLEKIGKKYDEAYKIKKYLSKVDNI